MASDERSLRSFLEDVREKLFPTGQAEILSPTSPPRWERLGWKVGWILNESHTGLQFWLTEEHQWDILTRDLGRNQRQKNQVFLDWYDEYIEELRHELGVPLQLEELRRRQMDTSEFRDKPLIEDEDWWQIELAHEQHGSWFLILPQKFVNFLEEDVQSKDSVDPPWDFMELWNRISTPMRQDLLQEIALDKGLRNHLVSLVLSTDLDQSEVQNLLPRTPREEFLNTLEEREETINSMSRRRRNQTLDRWKEDALTHLLKRTGDWLEDDVLKGSEWKSIRTEWVDFKREMLSDTYDTDSWTNLWSRLSDRDLKQLAPRLDAEQLIVSLQQVPRSLKSRFKDALPDRFRKKLRQRRKNMSKDELLEARRDVFQEGKEVIRGMDYELDAEWGLSKGDE